MELNNIKLETTWNDAAASLNDNFAKVKQAIALGSLGHPVMLDTEMSDDSTNVVQNKVIKKYVDDKEVYLEGYSEEVVNALEVRIKENPSEFVPLKTINGKTIYGEGNIVIEGGGGTGTGLKYSEERTVYLTEIHDGEVAKLEITEEERAYNIETFNKAWDNHNVFISWFGIYFNPIEMRKGETYGSATFNALAEYNDTLVSYIIKVDTNGDAIATLKEIQTGGCSATSDFNNDFNNDF